MGGPWQRGYLRAELDLTAADWFFQGHFKDDPCMPGTIMFQGCLQAMAVAFAARGATLARDGHRFEPGNRPTMLRCRGQATPSSRALVYEVFVKGVLHDVLTADVLATVDGLKSLHCRDVELRLAVDWPLSSMPAHRGLVTKSDGRDGVDVASPTKVVARPVRFDQQALLATAIGKPSDAFGALYAPFDHGRRVPRLPGPPYHFMTRVIEVDGPPQGEMRAGGTVVVEYDVPADAWFFDDGAMPFAVLLEVALQPCGWLSSYVGSALTTTNDLFYRNLDGRGVVRAEVGPSVGTLVTRATLTKVSQSGEMIIQELALRVSRLDDDAEVFSATTVFGFFPAASLAQQKGVGTTDIDRARLAERCPATLRDGSRLPVDLTTSPQRFCAGALALPGAMLRMIDRVTGYWDDGSAARLPRVRTEKDVDVGEWFFRAHFFEDPVQPGSLGLQAMVQALQFAAIERGLGANLAAPRFVVPARDAPLVWRYRGQVVPSNRLIQVELDVTELSEEAPGGAARIVGSAALWVDGLRIYTAEGITLDVVEDAPTR
jgi:3-hydroxymyristoyl/3-hydroxydecanoyl-(acyl carrier protein) dehydratase